MIRGPCNTGPRQRTPGTSDGIAVASAEKRTVEIRRNGVEFECNDRPRDEAIVLWLEEQKLF